MELLCFLFQKAAECEVSHRPPHHVTQPAPLHPAALRLLTPRGQTDGWSTGNGTRLHPPLRIPGTPERSSDSAPRPGTPLPAAGAAVARLPTAEVWQAQHRGKFGEAAPGEKPAAGWSFEAAAGAGGHFWDSSERERAAQGPAEGAEGQDRGWGEDGGGTDEKPCSFMRTSLQENQLVTSGRKK